MIFLKPLPSLFRTRLDSMSGLPPEVLGYTILTADGHGRPPGAKAAGFPYNDRGSEQFSIQINVRRTSLSHQFPATHSLFIYIYGS
jgi:hypothetical protein